MENTAMELTPEQKTFISDYIRSHMQEWAGVYLDNRVLSEREIALNERILRVEASIEKNQALMQQGFDQMEKRFEQIDKRFEQVDKRFDQLIGEMNARFGQVDKRFNQMFWFGTTGFVMLGVLMTAFQIFS